QPGWSPATFNGHDEIWPLTGAHTTASCIDCHESGYTNTSNECASCHIDAYNQTTDPNHVESGFPTECEVCHTTNPGWTPANYSGHDEIWPLTGAHTSATCFDCHQGSYTNTPNECAGCHIENFNQTSNPDHNELGLTNNCALCHTTDPDWQPATFPVHDEYYVLEGAHVAIANNCFECHEGNYTTTPNTCYGCHQEDYTSTNDPNHQAAQFPTDCEMCHNQNAWEPSTFNHDNQYFPIYSGEHEGEWDQCSDCHSDPTNYAIFQCLTCHPQGEMDDEHEGIPGYVYNSINCLECHPDGGNATGFDHGLTNFPLDGAHSTVDCFDCHQGSYENTPSECVACHIENFNQTTDPNHVQAGFPQECNICHTTDPGWTPASFSTHDEIWPLTGAHETISCNECHQGNYTTISNECASCHINNYNQTTDPDHGEIGFATTCEECHTTNPGWSPATFAEHDNFFPLNGAHTTISCYECHEGSYTNTPNECVGCHLDNYNQTNDPNHVESGFPQECEICHTTSPGWSPASYNGHDEIWPLTGAHETTSCNECHQGNYTTIPNECASCHISNYNQTTDPDHGEIGFATTCEECHTTNPGWSPATYADHDNFFPLNGAHTTISCYDCHEGSYTNTPNECAGCHIDNYNQTTDPNHIESGFPQECEICHTTSPGWSPATFNNHDDIWPLTGAHETISCNECHQGNYTNMSNECQSCHIENYNQTTNPDHSGNGFSTNCDECHTTNPGWSPANYANHENVFPLTGAHASISCNDCHEGGYGNTPNECSGCHIENYNQTTDPNHIESGYPTECQVCHTTNPGWSPASYSGHDEFYPLTGAHETVSCFDCHEGNYTNTPNECAGCHIENYNATSNPDHNDLGLTNDCAQCHTTNPNWQPATFPVHDDFYQLQGAHASIANDCFECHEGSYSNTPNTCFGCHEGDYNSTNDPNHQLAQFPTDCEPCHSQTAWTPSTFNHDSQYFPIYSGKHQGEWDQCIDCHTTPGNFTIFDCINCHSNAHHQSQGNAGCYSCHPNGNGKSPVNMQIERTR
ncbi:MAG TPA: hypothetical protein PK904_15280, partial [Bacteroidales bacterium]|nr:hypothetical protein [Bacteroidales bacterium]